MKKSVFIIVLLTLLLSVNVFAGGLGLRSDSLLVKIDYEKQSEGQYTYTLILYGDEVRDVKIYISDDREDGTAASLAKYFTVDKQIIRDVSSKGGASFTINMRLPEKINEPGVHKLHVGAVEMLGETGAFGAKTAVEALFFINVLHDGKYLVYSLAAEDVNQGEPVLAELTVNNLGTDEIKNIYADAELIDFNKKIAAEEKTETIALMSRARKSLNAELSTSNLLPGSYTVNATIHHDGEINHIGTDIKIGELNLRIVNQTKEISAGKINEIEAEVESQWADTLNEVYAAIKIGNSPAVRTLPETIKGFETSKLKAFFDAKDIKQGTYDMEINVYFNDKTTSKTAKIKVTKDPMRVPMLNITAANFTFLIMISVVLIINIILFVVLMKKKNEHEKEKGN